jgi:elongator complex protein 1
MIEKLDGVRAETKRLLEGLVRRHMRERAVALQTLVNNVLDSLRGCVREVFDEAGAVVNPEAGGEQRPRVTPVVDKFDGLAVL